MGTTIRDVARAAEVSIGTVSRALKTSRAFPKPRVRASSRSQRLGYDPAQLRPRIRRLTFLLHRQHNRFPASPFFSHVLHGVEDACRERGIVPTLLTVGPNDDVLRQMRRTRPTRSRWPASSSPRRSRRSPRPPTARADRPVGARAALGEHRRDGRGARDAPPARHRPHADRVHRRLARALQHRAARSATGARSSRPGGCSIPRTK